MMLISHPLADLSYSILPQEELYTALFITCRLPYNHYIRMITENHIVTHPTDDRLYDDDILPSSSSVAVALVSDYSSGQASCPYSAGTPCISVSSRHQPIPPSSPPLHRLLTVQHQYSKSQRNGLFLFSV